MRRASKQEENGGARGGGERACATGAHLARKLLSCFFGTVVDISVGGLIPAAVVSATYASDRVRPRNWPRADPIKLPRDRSPIDVFTRPRSPRWNFFGNLETRGGERETWRETEFVDTETEMFRPGIDNGV